MASKCSIAAPGSSIPKRSPRLASKPGAELARKAGETEQRHQARRLGREKLVQRDVVRKCRRGGRALRRETPISPSRAQARSSSSVALRLRRAAATSAAVSASMLRAPAHAWRGALAAAAELGSRPRRRRVAANRREGPRRSRGPGLGDLTVERSSNASRHWPKRSRRRPRARISAIAAAETAHCGG